jgi:anti-anti-sigma factor
VVSSYPDRPTILVRRHGPVTVFSLVGEHDLTTADDLAVKITEQTRIGRGVVISLQQAEFIDSSIIQVLFQADRGLRQHGRRLALHTNTTDTVERLLELARIPDQLPCCDTIPESLELAEQTSAALDAA